MAHGGADKTGNRFNIEETVSRSSNESLSAELQTSSFQGLLPDAIFKRIRLQLIAAGKDVADLVVESHRILNIFRDFYCEWNECRGESITLLEQLEAVIIKTSKESDKIADVISGLDKLADNVPNPAVSWGTKIATAIGAFFAGLFAKGMSEKDVKAKEFEMRQIFQKDIDSTSQVYVKGVMCCSQFQEARKGIKKFHRLIMEEEDLAPIIKDENALEFLTEIAFYNPDNVSVFYKRLKFCYERLLMNSKSAESRHFIRVFEDVPAAIQVIHSLAWNFDTDGYDVSVVDNAWKEIFELFFKPEDFTIKLFLDKVQNCIFFLKKERRIFERTISDLIKEKQVNL